MCFFERVVLSAFDVSVSAPDYTSLANETGSSGSSPTRARSQAKSIVPRLSLQFGTHDLPIRLLAYHGAPRPTNEFISPKRHENRRSPTYWCRITRASHLARCARERTFLMATRLLVEVKCASEGAHRSRRLAKPTVLTEGIVNETSSLPTLRS